jgi:uncharacterized protein (TIGR04255 family)
MPHYDKAPITEALIDIRSEMSSDLTLERLKTAKSLLPDYPLETERKMAHATFQIGVEVQASAEQKSWGFLYRNEGNTQVAQFRVDGFTFSRLEPYETWERLRDEARRIWNIYRELAKPKSITRVAVRYINVLQLPGPSVEPEDYLNTFPVVSQELPANLRDFGPFILNLRMQQPDLKGTLVLNEGNAIPKKPDNIAIFLDLDLFVENPPTKSEDELWTFLEKLRERKNQYFEACITDKTRELIK